jgi:tetratricopeptide (TPR) repeat protein
MARKTATTTENAPGVAARSASSRPEEHREPADAQALASGTPEGRVADFVLIGLFLALVALLGVFPLKDTDFWWHLRTGDWIRQTRSLPTFDLYTFTASDHRWVDLHWMFQLILSYGYERFGIVGLNVGKCAITVLAVGLLIWARGRRCDVAALLLAWLPALLVLAGRMYVRPETLTLLWLAATLSIINRWDDWPRLAWLLPVIQVFWVNTQGLFILGPVIVGAGVVEAFFRPGALGAQHRSWWRTVLPGVLLMAPACLINPYGLRGALFPIDLLRTMGDPVFSQTIAELMPLSTFVAQAGLRNVPLLLHLATMALGLLSFVVPLVWLRLWRVRHREYLDLALKPRRSRAEARPRPAVPTWTFRLGRFLLYVAFSLLSLKATRNSHQFAAVVGAVTAWNLGEWAYAARQARAWAAGTIELPHVVARRLTAMGAIVGLIVLVATGRLYAWEGEGRTIGLGEEPLWFAHEAVATAKGPGMPDRFACFHNGHAALFEYVNGPRIKTLADARLEVIGPELHRRYLGLERSISQDLNSTQAVEAYKRTLPADDPTRDALVAWPEEMVRLGSPGIVADLVQAGSADLVATLLARSDWACISFDAVAATFVPASAPAARRSIDFLDRFFRPGPSKTRGDSVDVHIATARACSNVAMTLAQRNRIDLARPLILIGLSHARRALKMAPANHDPWKMIGTLEAIRDPVMAPRFRLPFDPVFDIHPARATYNLRQAQALRPEDQKVLLLLASSYQSRGMFEAAYPLYERLATLAPSNQKKSITAMMNREAVTAAARCLAEMGDPADESWRNLDDLDRSVRTALARGRAQAAAEIIEDAYPNQARPWDQADRLATLWLHLGRPELARAVWRAVRVPPRPALVASRIAATYLVEDDFGSARRSYNEALRTEPQLFEAQFGLAATELESARAFEAHSQARYALPIAPNDVSADAVRLITELTAPYAGIAANPDKGP